AARDPRPGLQPGFAWPAAATPAAPTGPRPRRLNLRPRDGVKWGPRSRAFPPESCPTPFPYLTPFLPFPSHGQPEQPGRPGAARPRYPAARAVAGRGDARAQHLRLARLHALDRGDGARFRGR